MSLRPPVCSAWRAVCFGSISASGKCQAASVFTGANVLHCARALTRSEERRVRFLFSPLAIAALDLPRCPGDESKGQSAAELRRQCGQLIKGGSR